MIFRVEKTKGYTVMSNYHLRDKRLSFKAVGLLSIMLSLPDDWNFSIRAISSDRKECKDTVMRIIHDLERFGYISREQCFDGKGRFKEVTYVIREIPVLPCPKNKDTVKSCPENPCPKNEDNNELLNELIINKQSTNILSTDVDAGDQESRPVEEQQQQPEDFIFVGTDKNVRVRKSFYETFKNTYSYYKLVFNALSEYKTKNSITAHVTDEKYLLEWAVTDRERFEHQFSKSSFDIDDLFEAALKRSYQRHNTEG